MRRAISSMSARRTISASAWFRLIPAPTASGRGPILITAAPSGDSLRPRAGPPSGAGRLAEGASDAGGGGRRLPRARSRRVRSRLDLRLGEPRVEETELRTQRHAALGGRALGADHARGHDPRRYAPPEDLDRLEVALEVAAQLRL